MQPPPPHDMPLPRARLFDPAPNDLRLLVLDYLCHNSYSAAARAFMRDSALNHLDPDGDEIMAPDAPDAPDSLVDPAAFDERLASGELRREIRTRILSGQIDDAIALLNAHFPAVLADAADADPRPDPPADRLLYVPATSVDPTHLALNLRIQAFIEAARTVPLPYRAAPAPAPEPDDQKQVQLLHRAQSLYSDANSLPAAADRALYLAELAQVSALLAYRAPERGPMAPYMAQARREGVADQVEAAVLYRTGQPTASKIELAARYTSVLWSALHDMDVKAPPPAAWPAGLALPSSRTPAPLAKSTPRKKVGDDAQETVPRFDLHAFMREAP